MYSNNGLTATDYPTSPRWLHLWAVLTVLLSFGLLLLGALVTSLGASLADPDGQSHVREPWIMIRQWQEGSLAERGLGYVIEHGHRLAGILVGLSTIVLAIGLWFGECRWWLRLFGPAALLAVIGQGVLGIFRVDLHAILGRNLALIHGLTAQLVFALLLCIAVFTSRGWSKPMPEQWRTETNYPRRFALVVLALVYGQLVLGGLVRHDMWQLAGRVHLLGAFIVTGAVIWLIREIFAAPAATRGQMIASFLLGGLLLGQVYLGMESWLSRFRAEDIFATAQAAPSAVHHSILRSLHYVAGSLVFANVLVLVLLAHRPVLRQTETSVSTSRRARELEGVA